MSDRIPRPSSRIPPLVVLRRRYLRTSLPTAQAKDDTLAPTGRAVTILIDVPWKVEIDRIILQVGSVSAGDIRVGLYKENGVVDRPDGGELMCESASVAVDAAYSSQFITVPDTILEAGKYHVAWQNTDATCRAQGVGGGGAWRYNQAYGPFTDPCPATNATVITPLFWLRIKRNIP